MVMLRSRFLLLSLFKGLELVKFKGANRDWSMGVTDGTGNAADATMF